MLVSSWIGWLIGVLGGFEGRTNIQLLLLVLTGGREMHKCIRDGSAGPPASSEKNTPALCFLLFCVYCLGILPLVLAASVFSFALWPRAAISPPSRVCSSLMLEHFGPLLRNYNSSHDYCLMGFDLLFIFLLLKCCRALCKLWELDMRRWHCWRCPFSLPKMNRLFFKGSNR